MVPAARPAAALGAAAALLLVAVISPVPANADVVCSGIAPLLLPTGSCDTYTVNKAAFFLVTPPTTVAGITVEFVANVPPTPIAPPPVITTVGADTLFTLLRGHTYTYRILEGVTQRCPPSTVVVPACTPICQDLVVPIAATALDQDCQYQMGGPPLPAAAVAPVPADPNFPNNLKPTTMVTTNAIWTANSVGSAALNAFISFNATNTLVPITQVVFPIGSYRIGTLQIAYPNGLESARCDKLLTVSDTTNYGNVAPILANPLPCFYGESNRAFTNFDIPIGRIATRAPPAGGVSCKVPTAAGLPTAVSAELCTPQFKDTKRRKRVCQTGNVVASGIGVPIVNGEATKSSTVQPPYVDVLKKYTANSQQLTLTLINWDANGPLLGLPPPAVGAPANPPPAKATAVITLFKTARAARGRGCLPVNNQLPAAPAPGGP